MRTIWLLVVDDAGGAVGGVALGGDALVPVVVGRGGVLQLDGFEPGVFARRLVEVAVDADVAAVGKWRSLWRDGTRERLWMIRSAHVMSSMLTDVGGGEVDGECKFRRLKRNWERKRSSPLSSPTDRPSYQRVGLAKEDQSRRLRD